MVQVLRPGWYALEPPHAYPSVLFNMNDVKLYGIFIRKGRASLCASVHPVSVWNLESEEVPKGMEISPGVCLGQTLWLMGGSIADPDNSSNMVCSYEGKRGEWDCREASWPPRMGHGCVVFKHKIWVLGGMDEVGRGLHDVWSWDARGEWMPHGEAPWQGRCMFAATVFRDRIWIYGGVTEPFGDPLEDMWTSDDGETWERYETIPRDAGDPIGKPIGCAMQVVSGKLNLIGSFRRDTTVRPRKFTLEEAQETWQASEIQEPWHQQGGNTFSLLSVGYKGLVFLRSLNYQTHDNPTKLHVYRPSF